MRKAHSLWPAGMRKQLARRAHVSPRAVDHWTAGTREIGAEAIAHLLRSDEGIHFLVALMDRARPAWWSALLRMGALGGIQRRREADLRLMRRIANADTDASAGLPAALMVQDPEFFEPLFEAARAHADGAHGRAVGPRRR